MKVYDRAYERRLRRAVAERLRSSPELRGLAHKRAGDRRLLEHPAIVLPILLLFLAASVQIRSAQSESTPLVLLPLSLYAVYFVVSRSIILRSQFISSPQRYLFLLYPFSESDYFQWVLRPFLFRSLLLWLLSAAMFAALLAGWAGARLLQVLAFATLHWFLALLFIFFLARFVPRIPKWLPVILRFAFAIPLFVRPAQLAFLVHLQWLTPFGWIDYFAANFARVPWAWFWLATMTAAGAAAAMIAFWAFRRAFLPAEHASSSSVSISDAASDRLPGQLHEAGIEMIDEKAETKDNHDAAANELPAAPESLAVQGNHVRAGTVTQSQQLRRHYWGARIENYVRGGDALASWDWSLAPWFERLAVFALTARERNILEFLLGGVTPDWGGSWRASVIAAAASAACAILPPEPSFILVFAGLGISAFIGLPLIAGEWTALLPYRITSQRSPIYSCFPLDYRETFRVIAKINLFRILAWLPFCVFLSALLGSILASAPWRGALIGANLALCIAASQPAFVAAQFSMQTNDTQGFRPSTILFIVLVPLVAIACFAAIVTLVSWPGPIALLAPVIVSFFSFTGWAIYGRYYARGRFDLLRTPKS